jgi:hypothetical protein
MYLFYDQTSKLKKEGSTFKLLHELSIVTESTLPPQWNNITINWLLLNSIKTQPCKLGVAHVLSHVFQKCFRTSVKSDQHETHDG